MPSQQVEIAEAIAGIKRALKREREPPSDQPAVGASNRGNKLKQGAKYIHEGSLTYASGPEIYREKIEHAGYVRYILKRNPRRYNEYGEELEDSETDEEADADAADENAYSGIRLEELLCPLKHPSELPIHPTMSYAYLSNALPDMVMSTDEKLRQERANLWRAKYLSRQLIGDAIWIPAGEVETPNDWELFEPSKQSARGQPSRKRKRKGEEHHHENSNGDLPSEAGPALNGTGKGNVNPVQDEDLAQMNGPEAANVTAGSEAATDPQIAKSDGGDDRQTDGTVQEDTVPSAGVGSTEAALKADIGAIAESALNGIGTGPAEESGRKDEQRQNRPPNGREEEEEAGAHLEGIPDAGGRLEDQVSNTLSQENGVSPPPPSRRITRALAANKNPASHSNAPTPPLSPASSSTNDSSSSHLQIHPLYLVSPSANPSNSAIAFHGLLPEEALETRRLLALYIQKQEESVRGYEAILSKLLTAQRLRSEVLEMCKTEEHVGELSDGEDWIDAEKWGLQAGELRKGRDEDEDAMEENNFGGRKGKRRGRN